MSGPKLREDGATTGQSFRVYLARLTAILVFLAINGSVAFVAEPGQLFTTWESEVGEGLVLGMVFAQSTILAVWSAWGTWTMFRRVATSMVLVSIAGSAL